MALHDPYMALSCSGRWPFLDGPGWFWEGPGAPESVAIARYSVVFGVIGKAFNP